MAAPSSGPGHDRRPEHEPDPDVDEGPEGETDEERARRLAGKVGEENPDPTTRREAIEQALADEEVAEEGEELGQHND
jgi:hypothetical protein